MLRIRPVAMEMVRDVGALAELIGRSDRDLARQVRKASMSVPLNLAEGSAVRDGRRRARYGDALGSAMETLAGLEAAEAVGYIDGIDAVVRNRFNHIIGVLVKLVR